jgi:hypothetical protein
MHTRRVTEISPAERTVSRWRPTFIALDAVALIWTLVLATIGTMIAGFGVMTVCTDDYDCVSSFCGPCRPANAWLISGTVAQVVLFLCGASLFWFAAKRPANIRRYTFIAISIIVVAAAVIVFTTHMANHAFR